MSLEDFNKKLQLTFMEIVEQYEKMTPEERKIAGEKTERDFERFIRRLSRRSLI